jgi:hypothetical protein
MDVFTDDAKEVQSATIVAAAELDASALAAVTNATVEQNPPVLDRDEC